MESLFSIFLKSLIPTGIFFVIQQFVFKMVSLPPKITEVKDPIKHTQVKHYYLSNFTAFFHSTVLIIFGGYFTITKWNTGYDQSSFEEDLVIYVKFLLLCEFFSQSSGQSDISWRILYWDL